MWALKRTVSDCYFQHLKQMFKKVFTILCSFLFHFSRSIVYEGAQARGHLREIHSTIVCLKWLTQYSQLGEKFKCIDYIEFKF